MTSVEHHPEAVDWLWDGLNALIFSISDLRLQASWSRCRNTRDLVLKVFQSISTYKETFKKFVVFHHVSFGYRYSINSAFEN